MSTATYGVPKKSSGAGGAQWTPEQKAAYAESELAFARYMKNFAKGEIRTFDAVLLSISEPFEEENTYPGVPKGTMVTRRTVKIELRGNPAVQLAEGGAASPDGMRWQKNSADNPFNDKTLINQLLAATVGEPDDTKPFTIDYSSLEGLPIRVDIQKQGPRNDGKRGGFYSELKAIRRKVVDDLVFVKPATQVDTVSGFTVQPATKNPQPATASTSHNADPITESGIEDNLPWAE